MGVGVGGIEAGLAVAGWEIGAGKFFSVCGIDEVSCDTGESSGTLLRGTAVLVEVGFLLSSESDVNEGVDGEGGGPGSIRELVLPGRNLPTYAPRIIRSISVSPSLGRSRL